MAKNGPRGRGYGRGNGKGGGDRGGRGGVSSGRGRGRGGGGNTGAFPGQGRFLTESAALAHALDASRWDSGRGGAHRGRGGPARGDWNARGTGGRGRGRGGHLTMSNQNAVSFDYSSLPQRASRQAPAPSYAAVDAEVDARTALKAVLQQDQSSDSGSASEDDVILTPPKGYVHVHRPQHERQQSPPAPYEQSEESRVPAPPALHGDAMAELVSLGVPTGPRVMRLSGGTSIGTRGARTRGPAPSSRKQATFPHFQVPEKHWTRPDELVGDAAYLAGVGGKFSGKNQKPRFGDPAQQYNRPLLAPIAFIKAQGLSSEGEGVEEPSIEALNQAKQGRGLGFTHEKDPNVKPPQAPPLQRQVSEQNTPTAFEPSAWTFDEEAEDDDEDLQALMKAYPDARQVGMHEAYVVQPSAVDSMQQCAPVVKPLESFTAPTHQTAQEDSSEDEVILVPQSASLSSQAHVASLQDNSDSEEDRQLEAILAANRAAVAADDTISSQAQHQAQDVIDLSQSPRLKPTEQFRGQSATKPFAAQAEPSSQDVFYIDTQGTDVPAASFERAEMDVDPSAPILGDTASFVQTRHAIPDVLPPSDSDEEDYGRPGYPRTSRGFLPLNTQRGKSTRQATRKARRQRLRMAGKKSAFVPLPRARADVLEESDMDWGSGSGSISGTEEHEEELRGADLARALRLDPKEQAASASTAAPAFKALNARQRKKQKEEEMLADLAHGWAVDAGLSRSDEEKQGQNANGEDPDLDRQTELDAMIRFMKGMDAQSSGREMTLGDMEVEQQMKEEEEWMTASESEEEVENGLAEDETMAESEGAGPSRPTQRRGGRAPRGDENDNEDDSDEDEDGGEFGKNFSWADEDEEFIKQLEAFASANGVEKNDKKARKRLFKAIEKGDFSGIELDEDLIIDEDDEVFGLGTSKPVQGGRAGKKKFGSEDLWAEELQGHWEKDRASKAANKRKRAAERAAAAENPYHASVKKGTKKGAKKAARALRRAERKDDLLRDQGLLPDLDPASAWDAHAPLSTMEKHSTNLHDLNAQILRFLQDWQHSTLSLPPMDKRSRAQVHMLASAYSLTSKSKGNGNSRFATLIKNSKSGQVVDQNRVNKVLRGAGGGAFGATFGAKQKSKNRANGPAGRGAVRDAGRAAIVPKNQEGTQVGFGAEKIAESNIGHRLLSMMGWKEGSGVGATPGSAAAVGATIKISKGGLGF
ncbi:RNA-binding protein RBM5 and related proteins, contain G-patch and RRM domains [Ceraceosorus bombacis]|uniref:RNA-binding protein RBM5 and related proteins, contain G-patch and RRM domains n=1 Tax=Ceraceosorus bombacis TaxID=401625 RepID=A0A0P1BH65_9BASI|nr:RNA-binding protein RBM5 and related proteins, contain G-patch and RRM domains [Ceraceosorus bombacis]